MGCKKEAWDLRPGGEPSPGGVAKTACHNGKREEGDGARKGQYIHPRVSSRPRLSGRASGESVGRTGRWCKGSGLSCSLKEDHGGREKAIDKEATSRDLQLEGCARRSLGGGEQVGKLDDYSAAVGEMIAVQDAMYARAIGGKRCPSLRLLWPKRASKQG